MAVRLFILQTQYRKPVDFTEEALATATNSWETLKEGLLFGYQYGTELGFDLALKPISYQEKKVITQKFKDAMDDDFNFAGGLAVLFEVAKNLRKEGNVFVHEGKTETAAEDLESQWRTLIELSKVLGFEVQPEQDNQGNANGLSDAEIDSLVQQRNDARQNRDYAQSDRIRDELQAHGIILIDKLGGVTIWNRS
jgi:cysteinyl-tRNA synthetase